MNRPLRLTALLFALAAGQAFAQAPVYGPVDARNFGTTPFPATGSPVSRTSAARSAAVYNTKDYGAVCDGSHHSITATLGVSTISALGAYSNSVGGAHPYSWISNGSWNATVALPLSVAASSTNTTLRFDSALQIPVGATVTGTGVAGSTAVSAVSNPGTITQVTNGATNTRGTTSITVNSGAATPVGSHPTPQTGLSVDDYVVSSTTTNITLKYGITAASISSATTLTFQPPSTVTINNGLTANKPSIQSASSNASANYWVYFSWPLTDAMVAAAEMDWLGTQAAIEAATNAATGGKVVAPAGTCIMGNATVSGNALGGIVMHENVLQPNNIPSSGVDFVGTGNGLSGTTTLSWPSEMGAGRAAFSNGVPYATWDNSLGRYLPGSYYNGLIQDIMMIGPIGSASPTVGTVQTRTWGMLSGSRRILDRVSIQGFYVGATYESVDHTEWGNVNLLSNVMNLRVGAVSNAAYGNTSIRHLETAAAAIANISLDKDFYLDHFDIPLLYCAFAPKCIRLEPGAPDSYGGISGSGGVWSDSTISSTNAENIGLGFIYDDNYGPNATTAGASVAGGEITLNDTHFQKLDITYNATYRPAGSPMNFWIQAGNLFRSNFDFTTGEPAPVSGMVAAVFADNVNAGNGGNVFTGSFTSLLNSYGQTPFFQVYGVGFTGTFPALQVCEPGAWCGHPEQYLSGTTPAQGMALEYYWSGAYRVQPAGGTAPFAGIIMSAPTSNVSFELVIAASKFCYSSTGAAVVVPTSGSPAGSTIYWGKLAAGGTVTNASSATDGVVIGTILNVSGGNAQMRIGPNGSCDGYP